MRPSPSRLLVPLLTAGLLLTGTSAVGAVEPDELTDIRGTTHEAGIRAIVDSEVASGYPDATFRPGEGLSRGQMATVLANALELPPGDASRFSDVAGTTHEAAIGALAAAQIAGGYPDGTFRPDLDVTRGQLATFLANGFAFDPDDTVRFADVRGTTHAAAINTVAGAGITGGVIARLYEPGATVTRGQMATFVSRSLGLVATLVPADEVLPRPASLDVELRLTEVASMNAPTAGAVAPDGTLYLAERAGTVHPLTADGLGAAVVDVTSLTTTDGERGLLGIAFGPDELYLVTTDRGGDTVVHGIALAADGTPQPDQRRTIFTLAQPASNHNGGDVALGPDGLLYLALGDGGGSGDPAGNAQDLRTPLGSMVRIDPRSGDPYAIPRDNPFVRRAGAADEIYAYGLRNPWRFSFDRETAHLWIADVGQGAREEINRVTLDEGRGANFGWNLREGTVPYAGSAPAGHVPPVYEYATRGSQGCAVTGGYVYTGTAIPALRGAYLYADFCNGEVRGLVVRGDGEVARQAALGIDGGQVVSFVQDADGELYLLDLGGRVSRIDPA
jgi:glucose/arabinose dehydrogenase